MATAEKIREFNEQMAQLTADVARRRSLADNVQVQSDFLAASQGAQQAAGLAAVESQQAAAPRTARETVEQGHEKRMVDMDMWQAMLMAEAEKRADDAAAIAKLNTEVIQLKKAREQEQRSMSRMEFDVSGKLKTPYTRDALDRLLEAPSNDPLIQEIKEANDQCATVLAFVDFARRAASDPKQTKNGEFRVRPSAGSNASIIDIRDSASYKRLEQAVTRALYTTGTNAGADLAPTGYSSRIYDYYTAARVVMSKFQRIQMPASPFVIPCITALPTFYVGAQKTADDSTNYAASTPSTDSRTLTAVKGVCRTVWSGEANEQSLASWAQVLDGLMGKAWALAEETAGINGDTTATHFDTGYTLRSDDFKRAWAGLRHTAFDNATTAKMDLSTFTDANFLELIALLGKYAANPSENVIIASVKTYLKYIVGNPTFATNEKLGKPAANVTGTIGEAWGRAVAISGEFGADLDATGIYSAAGQTKSGILVAYTPAWIIGEIRGFTSKVAEDIDTDQLRMVTSAREIFQKLAPAADVTEAYGYNIG
jgi:HK97 family phage major capsid protein